MDTRKAIKIAVEALADYRKRFTFDANAAKYGFSNPVNERAVKMVAEIDEAKKKLLELERYMR